MSIRTIIIIVLAMSMLIYGMSLVKNIFTSEPEFKITKEVCGFGDAINVELILNNYYSSKVLGLSEYNLHTLINGDENISCDNSVCIVSFMTHPMVCKDVEVEEIREYFIYTEENPQCNFSENIQETLCKADFRIIISKQDLTIEWLNENCIQYSAKNCSSYNERNVCIEHKIKGYKCGDYKVEVLNE